MKTENKEIDSQILEEIKQSILSKDFGSVEIYIESGQVVQITERTIKKTNSFKNNNQHLKVYNSSIKR